VGIIENIGGAYIVGTELKLTMALAIIVAVLVLKPAGLFGKPLASRV
jgi:branched-chain amino acid transport system permease protein